MDSPQKFRFKFNPARESRGQTAHAARACALTRGQMAHVILHDIFSRFHRGEIDGEEARILIGVRVNGKDEIWALAQLGEAG